MMFDFSFGHVIRSKLLEKKTIQLTTFSTVRSCNINAVISHLTSEITSANLQVHLRLNKNGSNMLDTWFLGLVCDECLSVRN